MHKSFLFSLALMGTTACTFSVDGTAGKDTNSSYWDTDTGTADTDTATEACDTADMVEELTTDRLLHVEERSSYSGIDVEIIDNQMVLKSAADDRRVEGWVVNSTQTEDIVTLPTDVPDFDYTGSSAYAGYRIFQLVSDTGPNPLQLVCFAQDYSSTYAENGGSIVCLRKEQVTAGHSYTEADATFIAHFSTVDAYSGTGAIAEDFDGDGLTDLLMGGGADGVVSIDYDAFSSVKTATTFPVVKVYPLDADVGKTFTICDIDDNGVNDGSAYCQAQVYVENSHTLVVTDANYASGSMSSLIESYDLSVWPPVQTGQLTVSSINGGPNGTNVELIPSYNLVGINQWGVDRWLFLDPVSLMTEWTVDADTYCGAYGIEADSIDGVPYLWLGCVELDGAETKSGEVYTFDISAGMPVDTSYALFTLTEGDTTYGGADMDLGTSVDGMPIIAIGNQSSGDVGSNNGMNVYRLYDETVCP